ncbi:MAG: hypothetical protein KatS3mg003_1432 [Candidatus Nitrosocaldaceae archaeon]|nr:MAG: hypothetical protein KatS3mg003_1432 [Candidatus Nitrosocaldaceae archaeon]
MHNLFALIIPLLLISNTYTILYYDTSDNLSIRLYLRDNRIAFVEFIESDSELVGKTINYLSIYLEKDGSPVGEVLIGVFDSALNLKHEIGRLEASTFDWYSKRYEFYFSNYTIQANDMIGIKYMQGTSSNTVVTYETNNVINNAYLMYHNGTQWFAVPNRELGLLEIGYKSQKVEFNEALAYQYIISNYNTTLGLIKESETIDKYWLWTDNLLASHVLRDYDYQIASNITNTIRYYNEQYDLDYRHPIGALLDQIAYFNAVTNKQVIDNVWYSDSDGIELECKDYADIAFYKAIYYYKAQKYDLALKCYTQGNNMFDGIGFKDKAYYTDGYYTTYKLALWKLASDLTGYGNATEALKIIPYLQNSKTGGIYTHYTSDLKPVGLTNTETTALIIMAYNSEPKAIKGNEDDNTVKILVLGTILSAITAFFIRKITS